MTNVVRIGFLVAVVHGLEDIALLSLGRFLPVPIWAMYLIGLAASVIILTNLLHHVVLRNRIEIK